MQMLSVLVPVSIFCAVIIGLFVRLNMLIVTVQGRSMTPTLIDGDRVLVWRLWPKRWLRHGQLIVMYGSTIPRQNWPAVHMPPAQVPSLLLKRVFALPGETFPEEGLDLKRPPTEFTLVRVHSAENESIWRIPAGHLFLQGDNPDNSADSRTLGPFPLENLVGIVLAKLPNRRLVPL